MPGRPSAFGDVAGEIGFGIPYLQKSLADDANGDDTMRIIAHEFGHILQFNLINVEGHRLYNLLRPDGMASIKWVELHADFISGIYLATRYLRNPRDMSRLNDTIAGDDELQPQYHQGTTAERRRAFRDGFRSRLAINPINNPIFDLAFSAVPYVKTQFPM
jgi:hypothetical protein